MTLMLMWEQLDIWSCSSDFMTTSRPNPKKIASYFHLGSIWSEIKASIGSLIHSSTLKLHTSSSFAFKNTFSAIGGKKIVFLSSWVRCLFGSVECTSPLKQEMCPCSGKTNWECWTALKNLKEILKNSFGSFSMAFQGFCMPFSSYKNVTIKLSKYSGLNFLI